ncbi:MAG: sporulation peptidase YabG [Clostridia bacterium]|nr:sporulation peptidase YabG [Clostridia bacterium]
MTKNGLGRFFHSPQLAHLHIIYYNCEARIGGMTMDIKIGDLVGRKSYNFDVVFRVHDIIKQNDKVTIILNGVNIRLVADAPEADIVKLPLSKIDENKSNFDDRVKKLMRKLEKGTKRAVKATSPGFYRNEAQIFRRPGKILHIDGDKNYLDMCMKSYKELNIDAVGRVVAESEQPRAVEALLLQFTPDILVLTGHDAYVKPQQTESPEQKRRNLNTVSNYKNSMYYIESVKKARRYEPSLDDLVIFAGACQSYFEGIMEAGANFASSPERVLIHALDPVMVCEKIALTSIDQVVPLKEVLTGTITGLNGVGGVQTRGKYRDGMPRSLYNTV